MAREIRFYITETQLDDDDNIISEQDYLFDNDYTESGAIRLSPFPSTNVDTTVTFPIITVNEGIRVSSDQPIGIKINGAAALLTKGFIFMGSVTTLQINNNSGFDANIDITVYGS